jgi:hypothetical protein
MGKIRLSSILLFTLIIPYIMGYRLSAGTTPYALFGLIFLLLFLNFAVDLLSLKERNYRIVKIALFWTITFIVLGSTFISQIIVRKNTAPVYGVHDIILQQEAAARFLDQRINPYTATYFGTPLADWHYSDTEINPALYHFVMQPFYLLSYMPFHYAGIALFGFYDARMPLYVLYFGAVILAFFIGKSLENKLLFSTLIAFNPAMLPYTLEGRSDMYMFTFLLLGLIMLSKNKYSLAGIGIGLAFCIKQSVLPFIPFYVLYCMYNSLDSKSLAKIITGTLKKLASFILTVLLFITPFAIWDARGYLESTVLYLNGSALHSYPISGYGLGSLLMQMGIIADKNSYYPFLVWQILIMLPLTILFAYVLYKHRSVKVLIILYGLSLFVFWYLSRYFNNSHLGFLSVIFITAYFFPEKYGHRT